MKKERERAKKKKRTGEKTERRSRKITQHIRASSPAERETCLPELCHGSEVAGGGGRGDAKWSWQREDPGEEA